ANRLLLVEQSPSPVVLGQAENSQITGRVVVEEGAVVKDSTVLGPAFIARGAIVEEAYIGPFTSVGPGATVRRAEVEYSILEDAATVEEVPLRLHGCILGVGVRVTSRSGLPKAHRLVVGDLSTTFPAWSWVSNLLIHARVFLFLVFAGRRCLLGSGRRARKGIPGGV
ncbi:MAG: hypothetical protein M1157_04250, partial [Deinococcus sp.]|nr:hypothetical protein [Deinococcus sp.]